MRKKVAQLLSLIFIASFIHSFAYLRDASAQQQKSFLWRVQSSTTQAYVLGSIHFLKKEIYPLPKKIEDGFDLSDILVVEANLNDIGPKIFQKLIETGFYPENDTLEKHVSPITYELIKKELGGQGPSFHLIKRHRPWFLAMTLQARELLKLGFDPNHGIDKVFSYQGHGEEKDIGD